MTSTSVTSELIVAMSIVFGIVMPVLVLAYCAIVIASRCDDASDEQIIELLRARRERLTDADTDLEP